MARYTGGTDRRARRIPDQGSGVLVGVRRTKKPGDSWRKVTTVDIPGVGPAARTQGVEDIPLPGDGLNRTVRAVLMQTYIPVPGQEGKVALVAGSSQVLDLADSFLDIFDAITSTFRFVA